MVQIEWTEAALADVEEIHQYIERNSPRYAQLTVEKIQADALNLTHFPELGARLSEFKRSVYRETLSGNYRIIYRIDKRRNRILIIGVIHARRNLPPIMKRRKKH